MSPYYKQAATKNAMPPARDWCGVFFALHEKPPRQKRWVERAYAYNLYQGGQWSEVGSLPYVQIGGSQFTTTQNADGAAWNAKINERGLWRGEIAADLVFSQIPTRFPPPLPPPPPLTMNIHGCAPRRCVMPQGTVTLPDGKSISFSGSGYHDHNFGQLPLSTTDIWYWGRAPLHCDDNQIRQAVFYHLINVGASTYDEDGSATQTTWLTFEEDRKNENDATPVPPVRHNVPILTDPTRNAYGLKHFDRVLLAHTMRSDTEQWRVALRPKHGAFSEGPFYRRVPLTISAQQNILGQTAWTGRGEGIGEVFRPSRMLGPIASRAIFSRLRRR